ETAVTRVVEERLRQLEIQSVIGETGRDAGVERHHTVARQRLAQFREDTLRHHRIAGQRALRLQAGLSPRPERADLRAPARAVRLLTRAQRFEQLLRDGFRVAYDADLHRVVAADFVRVYVHLDDARLPVEDGVVPVRGVLVQPRSQREDHVGVVDRFEGFRRATVARR